MLVSHVSRVCLRAESNSSTTHRAPPSFNISYLCPTHRVSSGDAGGAIDIDEYDWDGDEEEGGQGDEEEDEDEDYEDDDDFHGDGDNSDEVAEEALPRTGDDGVGGEEEDVLFEAQNPGVSE